MNQSRVRDLYEPGPECVGATIKMSDPVRPFKLSVSQTAYPGTIIRLASNQTALCKCASGREWRSLLIAAECSDGKITHNVDYWDNAAARVLDSTDPLIHEVKAGQNYSGPDV
jgi:hypothetical protein